jgi:hypothetical protein
MLKTIYRKTVNFLLITLILIYLIFEELIWERIAEPIYGFIRKLKILQTLEHSILRLNRYAVLILFLILFAAVELLGLVAIGLFAEGQVVIASVLYIGKIPITAFTFWLFQIAKDKLLTFAWFTFCYEGLMSVIMKIKTSAIYLNVKAKIVSVKTAFKTVLSSEPVRRMKAMLGFKQVQ